MQARDTRETAAAEQALRQAVGASRVRAVLRPDQTSRPCPACRLYRAPGAAPASVAIGPTGLVAAPIGSKTVVWDPVSGRTSTFGQAALPPLATVAFSPDGQQILAGADDAFSVAASESGGAEPAVSVSGRGAVVFSPDGRQVVIGERDGVGIAGGRTLRVVRHLRTPVPDGGPAVAFGGQRNAALAVTTPSGVAVWRWPARGAPAAVLNGGPSAGSVAVSSDNRWVASAEGDRRNGVLSGSVWGIEPKQRKTLPEVSADAAVPLVFSPDGRRLLVIGTKTATLWRLGRSPSQEQELAGHLDNILAAAWSPDGAVVATASADSTIRLWETATGQTLTVLHGHEGDVTGVAFSADGRMVASRGSDRTLRLWNVKSGQVLRGAIAGLYAAQFSPDGRWIATGGEDGVARLYDAGGGAPRTVAQTDGAISAVAFSRQGQVLAAGGWNRGFLAVEDIATGRTMVARPASTGLLLAATFLPDGRIVTGDERGEVRLWSTSGGRLRRGPLLLRPGLGPMDVPFNLRADRDLIAVAVKNGTVHLLRHDGTLVKVLQAASGGDEVVYAASFSPDGRRLVTAGVRQPIRVWSVPDGESLLTIPGVPGTTFSAEFSPDGKLLITGGVDGAVRLWDAATGQPVAVLHEHADAVNAVSFDPGGGTILSAGTDRVARIYPCEPCEPVNRLDSLARARTSRDLTADELHRYSGQP